MWSCNLFSASSNFPGSWSRFFIVQVFPDPGFSWSRFLRIRDQGVWIQDLGPCFRSSRYTCLLYQKILDNILFVDEKDFLLGKSNSRLCYFCKLRDENVTHIFYKCNITRKLQKQINFYHEEHLKLSQSSPQKAFFCSMNLNSFLALPQNHISLFSNIYLSNIKGRDPFILDI